MPQWYAIQTRYRTEKRVQTQLGYKGLEIFLPLLREVHRWSDRRQAIEVPLFSGYAFVHLDPSSEGRSHVLQTAGVIRIVSFGGQATPIPVKQIEDLQLLLSRKVFCAVHPYLRVGQKVRIRGGCLNGLEGILEQAGDKNLVISIECIHQSVAVKIEGYGVELI